MSASAWRLVALLLLCSLPLLAAAGPKPRPAKPYPKPVSEAAPFPRPTQSAARAGEFDLQPGEVRMDGTITFADAAGGKVDVEVTAVAEAGKKPRVLDESQRETVTLGAGALVYVRGDRSRKLGIRR